MKKRMQFVRTDLAVESKEMYLEEEKKYKISGVSERSKTKRGMKVTRVVIDQEGAEAIGKDAGTYVTVYTDSVKSRDTMKQKETAEVLSEELKWLMEQSNITKDMHGLVVGLGNWHVTPDALGPIAVDHTLVTNHLFTLDEASVSDGYRQVSAVTPGVMGLTGLETSEIIQGIVEKIKPDFVIAIDALAARSVDRLNETIQLSNAGIAPGSGVGNKRKELSKDTLNIPVIAIGVPTVVDATTIASDTLDDLLKHFGHEWKHGDRPNRALVPGGFQFGKKEYSDEDLPNEAEREAILGLVGKLSEDEKRALIQEVLQPLGHNLIVTPKEVDDYLQDMGTLIATSLNIALHERVNPEDAAYFNQ